MLNLPWVMKRTLLDDIYHKELADREGRTPPISSRLVTSGFESEVTVGLYCKDCDNAVQPSAFNFTKTNYNYSGWDESWLGFALDTFKAEFEFEIDLSANAQGNLTLSLLKMSIGDYGVDADVEFQLYLTASAQAEMSFIAGMNLSVSCQSGTSVLLYSLKHKCSSPSLLLS